MRRQQWAYIPAIHAASHVDMKKESHACGSVPINSYGTPLGGSSAKKSSRNIKEKSFLKTYGVRLTCS